VSGAEAKLATETILCPLLPFWGVTTMDYLLILGIFTIGAGALGIFLQQRSIRARFYKEIRDQVQQALFGRRRL
jgi:hypothetical protein